MIFIYKNKVKDLHCMQLHPPPKKKSTTQNEEKKFYTRKNKRSKTLSSQANNFSRVTDYIAWSKKHEYLLYIAY